MKPLTCLLIAGMALPWSVFSYSTSSWSTNQTQNRENSASPIVVPEIPEIPKTPAVPENPKKEKISDKTKKPVGQLIQKKETSAPVKPQK